MGDMTTEVDTLFDLGEGPIPLMPDGMLDAVDADDDGGGPMAAARFITGEI